MLNVSRAKRAKAGGAPPHNQWRVPLPRGQTATLKPALNPTYFNVEDACTSSAVRRSAGRLLTKQPATKPNYSLPPVELFLSFLSHAAHDLEGFRVRRETRSPHLVLHEGEQRVQGGDAQRAVRLAQKAAQLHHGG
eukprot:7813559-Pyramimonas_sp.AAC.2